MGKWLDAPYPMVTAVRAGYVLPEFSFYLIIYRDAVNKLISEGIDPRPITDHVECVEVER